MIKHTQKFFENSKCQILYAKGPCYFEGIITACKQHKQLLTGKKNEENRVKELKARGPQYKSVGYLPVFLLKAIRVTYAAI